MSQKHAILTLSVLAAAALTAYTFVDATGAVATAEGNAFGAVVADTASGAQAPVDVLGTTIVTASGAISKGDYIEVAAGGKGATLDAGIAVAIALEDAADGGDCEVFLIPNVPAPAA